MENRKNTSMKEAVMSFMRKMMDIYWHPLYNYIGENKHLYKTATGLLFQYDKVNVYIGKTHISLEYYGSETLKLPIEEKKIELQYYDYTQVDDDFFDKIVGFSFNEKSLRLPLSSVVENLIIPTDNGHDKLIELSWNFAAQNSLMAFGSGNFYVPEGEFARLVNAMFFDADNDGLKVRHIKWMDFIPLSYDDTGSEYDSILIDLNIYKKLVRPDANYIYPLPSREDYKFSKLPQINRFIELAGNKQTNETTITSFLEMEENKFILTMAFFGKNIYSQLVCEWQS